MQDLLSKILNVSFLAFFAMGVVSFPTYIMPLRIFFAWIRSPFSRRHLTALRAKAVKDGYDAALYGFGQIYLLLFVGIVVSLLACAYAVAQLNVSILGGWLPTFFAAVIVIYLITLWTFPATVRVLKFYRTPEKLRSISLSYLQIWLWALATPALFYLGIGAAQAFINSFPYSSVAEQGRVMEYLSELQIFTSDAALTQCERIIQNYAGGFDRINLANAYVFSSVRGTQSVLLTYNFEKILPYEYIDAALFGIPGDFGCRMTNISTNKDVFFLNLYLYLFKAVATSYSAGLLYFPFQKLFAFIRRFV